MASSESSAVRGALGGEPVGEDLFGARATGVHQLPTTDRLLDGAEAHAQVEQRNAGLTGDLGSEGSISGHAADPPTHGAAQHLGVMDPVREVDRIHDTPSWSGWVGGAAGGQRLNWFGAGSRP